MVQAPCSDEGANVTECIEWRGATVNGYGKLGRNGKTWLAHRWAWTQAGWPIPAGMMILHRCDNRLCVNVDHLFLGSAKDNTQDMIAKGRQDFSGLHTGEWNKPGRIVRGERHGRATLTDDDVREMRRLYAAGMRQVDIARQYGRRQGYVSKVLTGAIWGHVT
jgi:hypothetical protein